ncbi:hypothetical protein HJG54_30725 [Leptolyngbya sp. NK1-12]|uniref:Uncharacterized protein n=1 Tax=Leptolyngbya sp. NK1-12 TaxID=2547451 RepID=A0AA96WYU6_9CYAN|nr:hypothetical protein [Leptolyngbya sp. NK1-12]WNZ27267.1 hypothetical protein HJG54_30725 [Leptolyngbya sp. NK1-12]
MTTQCVRAAAEPLMPSENYPSNEPNKVVWMGDSSVPAVPIKTITLTNFTDHTVYPFLATPNDAAAYGGGTIYDPEDPKNEDYRGYIGYTGSDGKNYLGLPAGETITITVPLVFWDGSRIFICNDSEYITPDAQFLQPNPPINPYQYYDKNQDGSTTLRLYQKSGTLTPSGITAVVMWFHGTQAIGPNNDAAAQLVEFTIRDPWQLNLNSTLDPGILGPLINYDVSYVDTIYLPVAVEATDAWVLNDAMKPPYATASYGWIGASQTEDQFQQALKNFTLTPLGQYFGGKGYTKYNFPAEMEAVAGVKLPSGAQAVGDSPFASHLSSYDPSNNQYMLISGGTGPIGTDPNTLPNGTTTLPVIWDSVNGPAQQAALLYGESQPGTMDVTCSVSGVIPAGTTLISVDVAGSTVTLSQPASNPDPSHQTGYIVHFQRPVTDYVTSTMLNLWYSWAKYYVQINHQLPTQTYTCSITADRVLTFTSVVPSNALVIGMQVTGPGIPDDSDGSLCTITALTTDDKAIASVTLSELVTVGSTGSYQFVAPPPIVGSDDEFMGNKIQPFALSFEGDDADTAKLFAQAVYLVMSAMSPIPPNPNDLKPLPRPVRLLYNVIGCNVGQIPHIGQDLSPKDDRIAGEIRDRLKSILRGVPDFKNPQWQESSGLWYPDPTTPTGGRSFNVRNLDPFVWFVHKQLGLSGYGFSVDDDIADVGARGATNIHIGIGGLGSSNQPGSLPNPNQWTYGAPYGPVTGQGQLADSTTIKLLDATVFWKLSPPDSNAGLLGAMVSGPGIVPGTRVETPNAGDHSVTLSQSVDSSVTPGNTYTYTFS